VETSQVTLREIVEAIGQDTGFPQDAVDSSVNAALVTVLAGHTDALLSLSARLGQVAAVLAERPAAAPAQLFRRGDDQYYPAPDDRAGEVASALRRSEHPVAYVDGPPPS
jgi:hypothetical protein